MKSKIIQLADSPTIPVPQPLLDVCHLQNEVEVEAQGGSLVMRGLQSPRAVWQQAFRKMAASEDDKLILNEAAATRWDEEEWEWYAFSHLAGKKDERTRFVAVLEIPPAESAETAVRVQIVKDAKGKK